MRMATSVTKVHDMSKYKALNNTGDTIVEVLIAIAIVSLVLTSAYALTNRNTAASQEAQEQTNALKLVERQSEQFLAKDTLPSPLPGCFDETGDMVPNTDAGCSVNAAGTKYDPATDGGAQYALRISEDSTRPGTYIINASWTTLNGLNANVSTYVRRADP